MSGRLSEAEREKDIAQMEVVERIREHEVVKLIRIKEGLFKVKKKQLKMMTTFLKAKLKQAWQTIEQIGKH